jgi:SAM-dependent methyltransferase
LRNRARSDGAALFLHEAARHDVEERLSEVNRTFTAPAVVTGQPGFWRDVLPGARIVADDEVLDLVPGAHDLLVHVLALHWANDPVGQLIQARRALRADGLLLCVTLGGRTLHELRSVLAEAEARLRGGLSARVAPMGEIRDLGGLLQRAGFSLPVADNLPLAAIYRDLHHLMRDLRAMGEQNALAGRPRAFTPRSLLDEAARIYAGTYPAETGISATYELVTLTGWAPDPSQPQPLRPGSASARLAEALGTREHPAGDPAAPDSD